MFHNELPLFEKKLEAIKQRGDFVGYECVSREAVKRSEGQLYSRDANALQELTPACRKYEREISHIIESLPALSLSLNEVKTKAMLAGSCRFFKYNLPEKMSRYDKTMCNQVNAALQKAEDNAINAFKAYQQTETNLHPKR